MSGRPVVPPAAPPPVDAGPAELVIPLRPTALRRVQLAQSVLEHGPIAVALLAAGVAALRGGARGAALALALAEVAAGAWQLAILATELRETAHLERARRAGLPLPSAAPRRVAWGDVAAGLLLGVAVWQLWSTTGRLRRPHAVLAVAMLGIGFARARLQERRGLRLSAHGVTFRRRPWGGTTIAWADVAGLELTPELLVVTAHDGRAIRLPASRYDGGRAALAAVREALPRFAPTLGG